MTITSAGSLLRYWQLAEDPVVFDHFIQRDRLIPIYLNAGIEHAWIKPVLETRIVFAVAMQMSIYHITAAPDIGPRQHWIMAKDYSAVSVDQFHHAHMRSQMLCGTLTPNP